MINETDICNANCYFTCYYFNPFLYLWSLSWFSRNPDNVEPGVGKWVSYLNREKKLDLLVGLRPTAPSAPKGLYIYGNVGSGLPLHLTQSLIYHRILSHLEFYIVVLLQSFQFSCWSRSCLFIILLQVEFLIQSRQWGTKITIPYPGKTMLMDMFYGATEGIVQHRKRLHFHEASTRFHVSVLICLYGWSVVWDNSICYILMHWRASRFFLHRLSL